MERKRDENWIRRLDEIWIRYSKDERKYPALYAEQENYIQIEIWNLNPWRQQEVLARKEDA